MKFNLRGERVEELPPADKFIDEHYTHCPECSRELGPEDTLQIYDDTAAEGLRGFIFFSCSSCGHEWKEPND